MNWDAVGAIAELVAAATVVVTLLLLLKQLRLSNLQAQQANELARADSQRDILKQVATHSMLVIQNPGLYSKIRDCYQNWEDAPEEAKSNFESWAASYFYIVEQAIEMHDRGLLSNETYSAMEMAAIRIVKTPGGEQWWRRKSKYIGAGVSSRINKRMSEIGGDVVPMLNLKTSSNANVPSGTSVTR